MNELSDSWLLNTIGIKNKKSYLICNDSKYRSAIESTFGIKFKEDIATTNKAMLRKEIIKISLDKERIKR